MSFKQHVEALILGNWSRRLKAMSRCISLTGIVFTGNQLSIASLWLMLAYYILATNWLLIVFWLQKHIFSKSLISNFLLSSENLLHSNTWFWAQATLCRFPAGSAPAIILLKQFTVRFCLHELLINKGMSLTWTYTSSGACRSWYL